MMMYETLPKLHEYLLYTVPKTQNVVYAADLLKIATLEEIQKLTWNLPNGWDYSGPSSTQFMNWEWWEKNYDKVIRMQNNCMCYYFYRTRG